MLLRNIRRPQTVQHLIEMETTVQRTKRKDSRSGGARLGKTTGTTSPHERRSVEPTADDMTDPKEVWKESETTPQQRRAPASTTGHGRVADAGDVAGHSSEPYDMEKQADMVGKQTDRRKPAGGTSKPSTTKR